MRLFRWLYLRRRRTQRPQEALCTTSCKNCTTNARIRLAEEHWRRALCVRRHAFVCLFFIGLPVDRAQPKAFDGGASFAGVIGAVAASPCSELAPKWPEIGPKLHFLTQIVAAAAAKTRARRSFVCSVGRVNRARAIAERIHRTIRDQLGARRYCTRR